MQHTKYMLTDFVLLVSSNPQWAVSGYVFGESEVRLGFSTAQGWAPQAPCCSGPAACPIGGCWPQGPGGWGLRPRAWRFLRSRVRPVFLR